MNKKIQECLNGEHGSYILPFLWLHGEPQERIKEEIIAIKNSGIREFCAESRPYEEFCKDSWWADFEFILKTAKEMDMGVWLLDDRKFPTGYANGYLEDETRKHLRKVNITERNMEVVGPVNNVKIWADGFLNHDLEEEVIKVVAFKHTKNEELDYSSHIDLTENYRDGYVYASFPDGVWRVCITIKTCFAHKESRMHYYIDMLNPESCRAMIDAVYQPHFDRFSEYFGNTFKGFFSDEPGFLNEAGTYYMTLGLQGANYPWREDIPRLIAESAGISEEEASLLIPGLWEDFGKNTSLVRTHYMEVISKQLSQNFSYALGNWCREHNVMYIGHVIEDNNAHIRMGYGAGHYFRALDGQDMAGMDSVLFQNIPGFTDYINRGVTADRGYLDTPLFHYTLPKMTASHSHIQPLKKGRAMCEIFGAYGWAEGIPYMKHTADIMLSSGINHFVPHAFTPIEFDPDCPPHFYNNGKNVQYPYFKNLMSYMGRVSHILQSGTHKPSVAVFYNAEAEWSGGNMQMFTEICKILTKGNIDFDIVPFDYLEKSAVENGKLKINNETYSALVVPECEILPVKEIECFNILAKNGLDVIFANCLPSKSAENKNISEQLGAFATVKSENLVECLREKGIYDITVEGENREYLRFYHIDCGDEQIYMFSNDAITKTLNLEVTLSQKGEFLAYDPWGNKIYRGETKNDKLHLVLEKGNALIIVFGGEIPADVPALTYEKERKTLPLEFDIYVKDINDKEFSLYAKKSAPFDISAPGKLINFCGEVKYKATFNKDKEYNVLDLGEVGEIAEVWCNGNYRGTRANAPYKFNLGDFEGEAELEIKVVSNTGHVKLTDGLNARLPIFPTGITGEISLCKYE